MEELQSLGLEVNSERERRKEAEQAAFQVRGSQSRKLVAVCSPHSQPCHITDVETIEKNTAVRYIWWEGLGTKLEVHSGL